MYIIIKALPIRSTSCSSFRQRKRVPYQRRNTPPRACHVPHQSPQSTPGPAHTQQMAQRPLALSDPRWPTGPHTRAKSSVTSCSAMAVLVLTYQYHLAYSHTRPCHTVLPATAGLRHCAQFTYSTSHFTFECAVVVRAACEAAILTPRSSAQLPQPLPMSRTQEWRFQGQQQQRLPTPWLPLSHLPSPPPGPGLPARAA